MFRSEINGSLSIGRLVAREIGPGAADPERMENGKKFGEGLFSVCGASNPLESHKNAKGLGIIPWKQVADFQKLAMHVRMYSMLLHISRKNGSVSV